MKVGITLLLLCLFPSLVLADPVGLPETQTREKLGLHGPVKTVVETSGPCEVRQGQWMQNRRDIILHKYEFDEGGRLLNDGRSVFDGHADQSYSYDPAGRLVLWLMERDERMQPGDLPVLTVMQVAYSYNTQGRLQQITSETEYASQPGVKVKSIIDYTYDAQGQITEVRERYAAGDVFSVTRWKYDERGREITRTTTDGKGVVQSSLTTTYAEDGGKTVETITRDSTGQQFNASTERFDPQGRSVELTRQKPAGTGQIFFRQVATYTEQGRMVRQETFQQGEPGRSMGVTTDYYDGKDRLLLSLTTDDKGLRFQSTYAYDSHGNTVLYAYTARPSRPDNPATWRQVVPTVLSNYQYDQYGNWTVHLYTEQLFEGNGDPVIENGLPKMRHSNAAREIVYFDEKK